MTVRMLVQRVTEMVVTKLGAADFPRVNPKSGLEETWNSHFRVPSVHQRGLNRLRLNGGPVAIHSVPLSGGLTLDFYARLGKADELVLTFHGALRKDRYIYPRFERVQSLHQKFGAHIAFADPTLGLDKSRQMLLSWYGGNPTWDPLGGILQVVDRAKSRTGARHVLCIGESGGGLPALRVSASIPGSLAFVRAPTTDVRNSMPAARKRYFGDVWGQPEEHVVLEHPDRFDMPRFYSQEDPQNFVYFAQSVRDEYFREKHYEPFRSALGGRNTEGAPLNGRRWFRLYDGESEGHGVMTPTEFSQHLDDALRWWRSCR